MKILIVFCLRFFYRYMTDLLQFWVVLLPVFPQQLLRKLKKWQINQKLSTVTHHITFRQEFILYIFPPLFSGRPEGICFVHQLSGQCGSVWTNGSELGLQLVSLFLEHYPQTLPAFLQFLLLLLLHSLPLKRWHTKTARNKVCGCTLDAKASSQNLCVWETAIFRILSLNFSFCGSSVISLLKSN